MTTNRQNARPFPRKPVSFSITRTNTHAEPRNSVESRECTADGQADEIHAKISPFSLSPRFSRPPPGDEVSARNADVHAE